MCCAYIYFYYLSSMLICVILETKSPLTSAHTCLRNDIAHPLVKMGVGAVPCYDENTVNMEKIPLYENKA